ncbi:MAG: hypothetical protein ACREF6_16685 [Alphaproteobacteria bacterium]
MTRRRRSLLATLAFVILPAGPGLADYQSARDAYLRGDFANAFELALPSALEGNARSRIGLGLMLARGEGMKSDIVRSYSWFDMAAADDVRNHAVIRILARANRDFLGKQMSAAQLERARLRTAMMQATPETLSFPSKIGFSLASKARKKPAAVTPASMIPVPMTKASAPLNGAAALAAAAPEQAAASYHIQLAALRSGSTDRLRTEWSRLSGRHAALGKLKPALVRMDLDAFGVYEGLRAGAFNTPQEAYAACRTLIENGDDCFVVAKRRTRN